MQCRCWSVFLLAGFAQGKHSPTVGKLGSSCRCSGCHIANLEGPQSMIVRKFPPLWWVMSITNLLQLSFMPSFPFFQWTGAGSIDRQVLQAFTTDLAVSLDTCIKFALHPDVHFDDRCQPPGPRPVVFPPLRNSRAPALFHPWADPSPCAALWWDYLRGSDRTSRVSRRWSIHILSSAIARFLTVTWLASRQLPSCSHVLFQLKCWKSTDARTPNPWLSVTLSPPTEGPNWLLWGPCRVQQDWCAEHR